MSPAMAGKDTSGVEAEKAGAAKLKLVALNVTIVKSATQDLKNLALNEIMKILRTCLLNGFKFEIVQEEYTAHKTSSIGPAQKFVKGILNFRLPENRPLRSVSLTYAIN